MDNGAISSYRRFLEGDEEAFEEIMRLYRVPLIRFVYGYVKNEEDAEDIAIDVFAYIIANKNKYDFTVSLKTYLFMLARSRALDFLRRRRKLVITGLDEAAELSAGENAESTLLEKEKRDAVRRAVDALPENMREAVRLVYFENMSYDECARVMKKSRKQIDNLLYKAKGKLRETLGKDNGFI